MLALGLAAALAGCAEGELRRYNPLADFALPKLNFDLPEMPRLTYAASDLLPDLAVRPATPPDVEGGIGGFAGAIDEPDGPLLWQTSLVADFRLSVHVFASQRDYLLQGRGSTVAVGPDLLWDLQVVSFEDRQRRLVALRPPLVQARMTATPEGTVRGLTIDFPAHRERRAAAPERDSAEYRALAEGLRYLVQPLPLAAVKVGDSLGRPQALELALASTSLAPQDDTIATRVAGRARYQGREAIVARHEGAISFRQNDDRLRFSIAGHVLYDRQSGLPLVSVLRLSREGVLNGQPINDRAHIQTQIVLTDSNS
ncbi:MAG: hypothetical protein FJX68_12375 [Alphaproteobacteria bacterium]|nr:hypothetical protein [Alphaproteobacteria bacterium]